MSSKQSDFMLSAQDVRHWQRKRSFHEVFEPDDAPSILSKRQRVENSRQIRGLVRDQFWNTLSKVWLTPRALQEFNRRNATQSLKQRFASDSERQPPEKSCVDISHLSAVSLKNLKRFARCGGPNLADLRGVSQAMGRWEDECSRWKLSASKTITSILKDHELSRVQLQEAEAVKQAERYFLLLQYQSDSYIVSL
jgi:hypothetical protein